MPSCLYNDFCIIFLFMATKPKLSELCSLKCRDGSKIEIITSIAPMWKDFGVLLEFDDDGTKMNLIEANQRVNGPAACCTEMFQTWLQGAGRQPVSWDLVIELLEDCEQTYTWHNRSKKHCRVGRERERSIVKQSRWFVLYF